MADARVIPIDGDRPRGRPRRRAAADGVEAGAARASGERARRRRRVTPLLEQAEADRATDLPVSRPAAGTVPRIRTARAGRRAADAATAPPDAAATARPDAVGARGDGRRPVPLVAPDVAAPGSPVARLATDAASAGERLARDLPDGASPTEVERRLAEALTFLRRRITGEYEVDEFGFDEHLTDTVLLQLLRPLYRRWFRVDVRGIENIPATGGALVVANHSGTIAVDSLMTQVAVHDEHPAHRHLRLLGADLVFATPVVGDLARKAGATLAGAHDAEALLRAGHLVGVWPEGFKGVGKPFSERYKLQRFGRGGFVSSALRTRTPIVPCAIVGAEEIYPIIGNMRTVARLLGLPYAPVTPTWPLLGPLGLVPLPSKWLIEFGTPIQTDDVPEGGTEDPMLVFDVTDQVRETIQQTLYSLLVQRRSVFF